MDGWDSSSLRRRRRQLSIPLLLRARGMHDRSRRRRLRAVSRKDASAPLLPLFIFLFDGRTQEPAVLALRAARLLAPSSPFLSVRFRAFAPPSHAQRCVFAQAAALQAFEQRRSAVGDVGGIYGTGNSIAFFTLSSFAIWTHHTFSSPVFSLSALLVHVGVYFGDPLA